MSQFTPIQSLARGLTLLEHLAASDIHDGLALQQLARAIDVKPPTAHNLMRTLVAHGYAEQRPGSPRYHLGPAAKNLGGRTASRALDLKERVAPKLLELQTQEPFVRFTLTEEIDGAVTITLRSTPERPGRLERPASSPLHPYDSASATLYQALWTSEERVAFRRRYPFEEYGSTRWPSLETLDGFLKTVRRVGYCAPPARVGKRHGHPVAAPIYDAAGGIAGLIAGYLAPEYADHDNAPSIKTLTTLIVEAADTLSASTTDLSSVSLPTTSPQEVAI